MDNTNSPAIDLNIDPNMIAAQDTSPQTAASIVKPVANPGVIDITPGSTDTFPPLSPVSNHIDTVPLSEPNTQDITPEPTPVVVAPAPEPPMMPLAAPITPNPAPVEPAPQTSPIAPVAASPLAEDPDLVKLIK